MGGNQRAERETRAETIHIYYRYNRFTVYTYIKDDKVSYHIDTPEEYDGTKENKLFENKKYFSKKINDYNSVKEFLNEFALVTSSIQNDVNNFVDNNIVDDTKEVKAFRVSQVISPIYGIRKDNYEGSEY